MAMLVIIDRADHTLADCDAMLQHLEAAGQARPAGRRYHVVARRETGFLLVDPWESQQALDHFAQAVVPLIEQRGGGFQPRIYPVHHIIEGT